MTRSSFRVGLVLGLAAGAAAAVVAVSRRGRPSVEEEVIAASSGIGVDAGAAASALPDPHDVPPGIDPAAGGSDSFSDDDDDAGTATATTHDVPPGIDPAAGGSDAGDGADDAGTATATAHDVPPGIDPAAGGSDAADAGAPWTDPIDGGSCPVTHPVKAKLASGIFHLPGMAMYGRTRADRCYRDPKAAEADGLRRSSR